MSNHTPGPWRVGMWGGQCSKAEHGNNHPGLIGPDPCVYVPRFYDIEGGIAGPEPGQMVVSVAYDGLEMSKDDARLIAAAPDLLAALVSWQRFWDDMPKGQLGKIACDIGLLNEAFLATSAALAKARP